MAEVIGKYDYGKGPWVLGPGEIVEVPPSPRELLDQVKAGMVPGVPIDLGATLKGIVSVLEALLPAEAIDLYGQTLVTQACGNCPELHFETVEAVRAHVMREHRGLQDRTTRELLAELRLRAENWAGADGSGWLADNVDLCMVTLGTMILDGKREP